MTWLVLAAIAVVVFVLLPRFGLAVLHREPPTRAAFLPWAATALFVVAWRLPNPSFEGTETFTQHAVGGGAACALLALWVALNARVRLATVRVLLAYGLAASLGVAVEIAELAYDEVADAGLTADAPWDLLANTFGAVVTALAAEAVLWWRAATRRSGA